jgi:hypothetical protein
MPDVSDRGRRAALSTALCLAMVFTCTPAVRAASPSSIDTAALSKVASIAEAHGAHGVYLDSGAVVIVLPTAAANRFSLADVSGLGVSVRLQQTDVSVEEAASMRSDIVALKTQIGPKYSYGFFFDLRVARMVVETDAPASAFASIAAKYGDHVDIHGDGTAELDWSRQADESSFWGGAAINASNGNGGWEACSSGYPVSSSAQAYMVTAGHCFNLGYTVYANHYGGNGQVEGSVYARNYPYIEAELISGGSYSPTIYNGAQGDETSHVSIWGRKYAWTGQTGYCRTGQTSGRYCDWAVGGTNAGYCANWPNNCTNGLYAFSGTPSSGGDSGGPVYYPYNGGALITGTIIGNTCVPGLGCTSYAEPIANVLSYWGLSQNCYVSCVVQP